MTFYKKYVIIILIYINYIYYLFILLIYLFILSMTYKAQWSEFEVQSLAFSILRKNLYPDYLVRGEYKFPGCRVDIAIFKAHKDQEPELKLVVEVKKSAYGTSDNQGQRYTHLTGVPCVYCRGADDAYKIISKIQEFL